MKNKCNFNQAPNCGSNQQQKQENPKKKVGLFFPSIINLEKCEEECDL